MSLEKGKSYTYLGGSPYVLSNGDLIKHGEEFVAKSNMEVSKEDAFHEVIDLDAIHGEALNDNVIFDKKKAEALKKASTDVKK
jgi:hypothetical protein